MSTKIQTIQLGLTRISSLLKLLGNPEQAFKTIHVAGTNGKGSVCSYTASILIECGKRTGKFTSPHLRYEWDAIEVDGVPVSQAQFEAIRSWVQVAANKVEASNFERQTAIAFELFKRNGVEIAVVEVGLGGKEDATNILPTSKIVASGITKISFDHEGFLGSDINEIALQKAGIMRPNVPCFADGTNSPEVIETLRNRAFEVGTEIEFVVEPDLPSLKLLPGRFQLQNAGIATRLVREAVPGINDQQIRQGVAKTKWPGRLTWLKPGVLIDGAHNRSAACELSEFVNLNLRPVYGKSITWIVAFSKPCDEILPLLVQPEDKVVATSFEPVVGMPWIKPQSPSSIVEVARKYCSSATNSEEIPELVPGTVVCGSLYLLPRVLPTKNEA